MHVETIAVIVGMGLITYGTRAGGLWLMQRVKPSPFVEAWLRYIPGAVLVAIVAPAVFTRGAPDAAAALATTLFAIRNRNLLLTIVFGIAAAYVLRHVL